MASATSSVYEILDEVSYSQSLEEDISCILALSYRMMKGAMLGFTIMGLPFWFIFMGMISLATN